MLAYDPAAIALSLTCTRFLSHANDKAEQQSEGSTWTNRMASKAEMLHLHPELITSPEHLLYKQNPYPKFPSVRTAPALFWCKYEPLLE